MSPMKHIFVDGHLAGPRGGVQLPRLLCREVPHEAAGATCSRKGGRAMRALQPLMYFFGAMSAIIALIWIVRAVR